ncbi:unnamed protein product [Prunus armeniaca]|uniref:Uncharacterized protein n=1 Tax=Prunus armeniaca TaxID=36596 RepID=A0A6J5UDI3_PRUAR|nr:unnamed protein product [Prunus armeniaca]
MLFIFASKLASLCDTPNDVVYLLAPRRRSRRLHLCHQRRGPQPHDDQLRLQRDQVGAPVVCGCSEFGQIDSPDGSSPTASITVSPTNPNRILSVWVVVVVGCVVEVKQGQEVVRVAAGECGG